MSGTATTVVRERGTREVAGGRGTADEPVVLGDVLADVLRTLAAGDPPRAGGRVALPRPTRG
ncbi:hypothetical protein ABZV64_10675 [Streptomyces sp. NPDC004959]|uniref:hypothetical protein n=1 Tax=unclassified Streptomyces TaxID=2593676 RepID=UPI0004C6F6EA|nr:hypothetical protein [Streptomyces sp. NRRL F-5630]